MQYVQCDDVVKRCTDGRCYVNIWARCGIMDYWKLLIRQYFNHKLVTV